MIQISIDRNFNWNYYKFDLNTFNEAMLDFFKLIHDLISEEYTIKFVIRLDS